MAGAVKGGGEPLFGDGHADAVGETLAERAGSGLDTGCMAVLGMAWGHAAVLAEVLELLEGEIVAGQVEQGVEEHGAVAGAEDEAVAVVPVGVGRVVAQMPAPEGQGGGGHAHGQAGVSRISGLDGVQCEHANGVDHVFFQFRIEGWAFERQGAAP